MSNEDWYSKIPDYTLRALNQYILHGIRGGDFLDSVLSNNLIGAFRHADQNNLDAMHHIVKFVYNYVPASAFGSIEIVRNWKGVDHE